MGNVWQAVVVTVLERVSPFVASRDWETVHAILLDQAGDDPAALEVLAEASWWLGRVEECMAVRDRLLAHYEALDERTSAARTAMLLAEDHRRRGRSAIAESLRRRAATLLDGTDETVEHGYLRLYQAERARRKGQLDVAQALLAEAAAVADRLGDADLAADVRQETGRVTILTGSVAEGLALMDEAMLLASAGRLSAYTTGKIFCCIVTACDELGDLERVNEWWRATEAWSTEHAVAVFPDMCRVHHANLLAHHGRWDDAEREARRACEELREVGWVLAAAYDTIGQIRRRRGDLDGAAEAYAECERYGVPAEAGCAMLLLAHGDVDGAARRIARALVAHTAGLGRARLRSAQVEIAVAAGDLETAEAATAELERIAETYGTLKLRAVASLARAHTSVAAQDWAVALEHLAVTLRQWHALDGPYEVATARVLHARACRALGDHDGASTSCELAEATLRELKADPSLVAIGMSHAPAPRRHPGSLTARELDVLRLLATGATNKEIATRLVVSQKTVARHLSNIFAKIGVSTRAAATAYAYRNGLIDR